MNTEKAVNLVNQILEANEEGSCDTLEGTFDSESVAALSCLIEVADGSAVIEALRN